MSIKKLLKQMVDSNASDLFYRAGGTPRLKIDGNIEQGADRLLGVDDLNTAIEELATHEQRELLKKNLDVDFAIFLKEFGRRFRVSIFMQQEGPAMVVRNIRDAIQTFEELNLPAEVLKKLSMEKRGMVLLTGSAGSGKSTTIASMINYINENAKRHILTIEEPIEFTFREKNSIINQRDLGVDVSSYTAALYAFTLQSPDIIYIGNTRDKDTMTAAITAAETGVLLLSTLHTINASQTVERIINFFPPHQHQEVKIQLSYLLKGVISLRLVPSKDGSGRLPACEVMLLTPTISRLIREGKILEMPQAMEEGVLFGMQSFNQSLVKLVRQGKVKEEDALDFADNKDEFILALKGIKKTLP